MRNVLILTVFLAFFSCNKKKANTTALKVETKKTNELPSAAVELDIYDFDGFQKFLNKTGNKTYVINFWATWCGPCVKELPFFERLNTQYADSVEVVLVSLDFPHAYESKLKPFIAKRKLKSQVIALNAPNENVWINKIDASWTGSIPATIIYNKNNRKFFERSFTFEELEHEVKQLNNYKD